MIVNTIAAALEPQCASCGHGTLAHNAIGGACTQCDCGRRLPWPSREQDETCPDCGAVWEHDGVDLGAAARIKQLGRLSGEPLQDDDAVIEAGAIETGTPVIVTDDYADHGGVR